MSWLVAHDVWPGVSADDPPPLQVNDWLRDEGRQTQYTIHGKDGPMGTIWTSYLIDATSIQRRDLVWIERLPVPIVPLRTTVDSVFTVDGVLDEFTLRIRNPQADIRLHGERFHSSFSFKLEMDPTADPQLFTLPLADGGTIAAAFNPFAHLDDIRVGQRWRMQIFNPVAALTGIGSRFLPLLVEVTGEEDIVTAAGVERCLVVESPNAKAWVDRHGIVHVQEATLPLIGRIRIVREPDFDEPARQEAQKASFYDMGTNTS